MQPRNTLLTAQSSPHSGELSSIKLGLIIFLGGPRRPHLHILTSLEKRLSIHPESYYCLNNYYSYGYDSHYKENQPCAVKKGRTGPALSRVTRQRIERTAHGSTPRVLPARGEAGHEQPGRGTIPQSEKALPSASLAQLCLFSFHDVSSTLRPSPFPLRLPSLGPSSRPACDATTPHHPPPSLRSATPNRWSHATPLFKVSRSFSLLREYILKCPHGLKTFIYWPLLYPMQPPDRKTGLLCLHTYHLFGICAQLLPGLKLFPYPGCRDLTILLSNCL